MKSLFPITVLAFFCVASPASAQSSPTGLRLADLNRLHIDPDCVFQFRAQGIGELAEKRMQRENLNNDRAYASEAATWISSLEKQKVAPSSIQKILCGEVAIGMSEDQVWLAKGTPLQTVSEETSSGVTKLLRFDGMMITLRNKKVIKITRVNQ